MFKNKQKGLEYMNYTALLKQLRTVDNEMSEVDLKLQVLIKLLIENQTILSKAKAQVDNNKINSDESLDIDLWEKEKKTKMLGIKIENLTSDIQSLELANIKFSEKDDAIIKSLKDELKSRKEEYKTMDRGDRMLAKKEFMAASGGKAESSEFDYKVTKDYIIQSKIDYDNLNNRKQELSKVKIDIEDKIKQMGTSLDFIRALQTKIMEIGLIENSSSSDLVFDKHFIQSDKTKRIGKIMIVAISFVITLLAMIVTLALIYVYDDRIFDDTDLGIVLPKIAIVGPRIVFDKIA